MMFATSIASERAHNIAKVCGEYQLINHPPCASSYRYYSLTKTKMEFTVFESISSCSVKNRLSIVVKYFNT